MNKSEPFTCMRNKKESLWLFFLVLNILLNEMMHYKQLTGAPSDPLKPGGPGVPLSP